MMSMNRNQCFDRIWPEDKQKGQFALSPDLG